MEQLVSIHYKLGVLFAAVAFSSVSFAQTPDVKPERIRGDIVSYKAGSSTVTVPENVPVVTPAPASRTDLTAGKKVFLVVTPGASGIYDAHVLFVEKDGVAPQF
jgi:hypothetical protein